MNATNTDDFGFSAQWVSLKEMESAGILNNPDEKYIVLILGKQGKAQIHINLKKRTVQEGTFTILFTDFHIYIENDTDFLCEYIYYTFDFMAEFPLLLKPRLAEKIGKKPCVKLSEEELKSLDGFYDLFKQQYNRRNHPSRIEIAKSILFIIMAEISMVYSEQMVNLGTTHSERLTDQFFRLLHDHAKTEHKPAFYADKMHFTVRYLSKVLKQETGKPLNKWVCDFSILAAKRLLRSTSLTSAQIAEEMQFPNPSFFAKYFKKYTGMTPVQYKGVKQNRP